MSTVKEILACKAGPRTRTVNEKRQLYRQAGGLMQFDTRLVQHQDPQRRAPGYIRAADANDSRLIADLESYWAHSHWYHRPDVVDANGLEVLGSSRNVFCLVQVSGATIGCNLYVSKHSSNSYQIVGQAVDRSKSPVMWALIGTYKSILDLMAAVHGFSTTNVTRGDVFKLANYSQSPMLKPAVTPAKVATYPITCQPSSPTLTTSLPTNGTP